jgi:hypothetical protein
MSPQTLFIIEWLNNNQGILAVVLFVITAIFGWFSGIFSALRRKPKFKLRVIDGPTFVTVMGTGRQFNNYTAHRTAIAIYLRITNTGSAPADIDNISIGYHWALQPFSKLWLKYSLGWFWLEQQAIAISDFQTSIGEHTKFYPFLTQHSVISGGRAETYLDVGRSTNGVVYFEQPESFGGCFPYSFKHNVKILIRVTDSFGGKHTRRFKIPRVTLSEARKYNPSFGLTFSILNGEEEPVELVTDHHGNLRS